MASFPLYNGLSDDFDRHNGSLSPYSNSSNIVLPYEKHYDLRMFHTTNLTVPWSLNDNTWWNGYRYATFGIGQVGTTRSINNVQTRPRTQTEIDTLTQTTLDAMTQGQIEIVQTTNGNEEWPSTDPDVTVGKDAAYRYSNSIRVNLDALSATVSGNEITDAVRTTNTQGDGRPATWGLTLSGNEITDTTRATGTQGDGRLNDSSYGIWEASTNLCTNGGFETGTAGWSPVNTTVSARTTTQAKFGAASCQVTLDTTNQVEGIVFGGIAYTNGLTYTLSAWVNGPSGQQLRLATAAVAAAPVTLTGGWQRITFTFTAGVGDNSFYVIRAAGATAAFTYYVDGVQVEQKPVATPYIHTDGATATRAAARVQAPASLLSATQGWVAARLRMGINYNTNLPGPPVFDWRIDNSTRITGSYYPAGSVWTLGRYAGGVGSAAQTVGLQSFVAGDSLTVIFRWTANQLGVSVGGSAFANVSDANIPSLGALIDFGSDGPNLNVIDSDILWLSSGTGTLTDADAVTFNGFGDTDPSILQLPSPDLSKPTLLWTAVNSTITPNQESSYGIWEASTNLLLNGNGATNTANWSGNSVAPTRDTTTYKFGSSSIKLNSAIGGGGYTRGSSATGQAIAAGTLVSSGVWLWTTDGVARQIYAYTRITHTDATTLLSSPTIVNLTSTPQFVRVAAVAVAAAKTGDLVELELDFNYSSTGTVNVGGAQIETRAIATPYIHTDGATASRGKAFATIPASALPPGTQGWMAFRVRMGIGPGDNQGFDLWSRYPGGVFGPGQELFLGGAGTFKFSKNGGVNPATSGVAWSARGDLVTVVAAWTPTGAKISVNGGAFTSGATDMTATDLSTTNGMIGNYQPTTNYAIDSDILWFACGTGTLIDADAATIHKYGNTDPTDQSVLPGSPTILWKANTASINTPKIVNSFFNDDISTDFNDGSNYNIELVLRSFPSQTDAAFLDLNGSSIDISSDTSFAAGLTDNLKFSASTTNITGVGGSFDTVVTWPLSSLTKANKAALKALRLNLSASASMTFIAQALRIVPAGWSSRQIGLDTKRQTLARQIPKAGGVEPSTLFGDMYFYQTRPQNITTYTFFNSGHAPSTGSDDNTFRHYYRYNPTTGDRIEVRISSRSTQTRLFIDQKVAGVTTNLASTGINTNILTAETDYLLVTTVNGTSVTATVYAANGLSLGAQSGTLTATGTTTITTRGSVGMSFEPYYYDFYLASFSTNIANFGKFVSSSFASRTPVSGATLYPRTSATKQLLVGGAIQAFADATATTTDGNTYTVVRANTANQGGVRYSNPVYIGDSAQVTISGKIQPVNAVNGTYRIGLIDKNDSVAWIYNLIGLLPNKYNSFSLLLPPGLFPQQYYLHVQQSGSDSDTFRVRDLSMVGNTIGWEASIDSGTTWQPFLNALNDRWTAVKFANPGTGLELRATALSDTAYIAGYNLVPRYSY